VSAADLGRLRWHSRRALLELDLVLERFWRDRGSDLKADEAEELARLLEMEDHDLWDAFCGRRDVGDVRLETMLAVLRQSGRDAAGMDGLTQQRNRS
jgi:antitoxin CptB